MSQELINPDSTEIQIKTPENVPGDFRSIFEEVETQVQEQLSASQLTIPGVKSSRLGRYDVDYNPETGEVTYLSSTTSTVIVIEQEGSEEELVLKVLREPNYRHKDRVNSGPIWDDFLPHHLFAWSGADDNEIDLKVGTAIQEDCLSGELSRGVLYNPETSPYEGLVAAKQLKNGQVEILPKEEISAERLVFPGLLMQRASMDFLTANIIDEWLEDARREKEDRLWPELDEQDIARLSALNVLAFDKARVEASSFLKEKYGSASFFLRCLAYETPKQASQMHNLYPNTNDSYPAIKEAAGYASQVISITEKIIRKKPELFENSRETIIIAHADSKPSNSALAARDREEVVAMVKGEVKAKFILLDAQSLAVKPGVMYESDGVDYAHWSIVPRSQQWAYGLKMLLGKGLDNIHEEALEMVIDETGTRWSKDDQTLYWVWVAYKMGGVEPLVNVGNYFSMDGRTLDSNLHLRAVMENYPRKSLDIARKAEGMVFQGLDF